ncbi:TetR family transcriptional regulator [Streptomyces sp. SID486]|uniref:TetR/AcrR family transcriptional regulator n=1 Tax=unclassified Streptomyces TaxID=2593676 RepID=UPI0013703653|nr:MULTISPECIES: TetR/AcrR family transcriptional regulator [unclassified Streptomyces]MYW20141.1 TetR family transcriptional regulator [Streptomyces sp. SID2955]MYW43941.1 TetR family transcriptional regulator [Streptomyces sp. SID161]MYX96129.1 TetR family transcriptional regulator [Streptomyces sp. SID486]
MPASSPRPRRPRSGNRRDETARLAVLHAADDLLAEHGFNALTVEAIARRAGVAKQTIYRWWPSKVEILLDTLVEDSDKRFPVPTTEPTAASIRDYLTGFARFLAVDPAGKVLLALLAEAQHDSRTAERLHERYLGPRRDQERDMLTRAVSAGEVSPELGPDATMDALVGPVVYRALTGAAVPGDLLDTLVRDLLRPRTK